MKILYICAEAELCVNEHIINFLKQKGITVVVDLIKLIRSFDANWNRFSDHSFQKKHNDEKYDFIISNTHSSFPQLRNFQNNVRPRVGFIDLEHDLMSNDLPEHFANYGKSLLLTFHNKHHASAIKFLKDRFITKARWIKLDVNYSSTLKCDYIDMWNDVILIGFGIWEGKDFSNVAWFKNFNKVWYKKYVESWTIKGLESLPNPFIGPLGSKYCADVCKFIVTEGSSCYQDALLFGSIPILITGGLKSESIVDDIISEVTLKSWQPPGVSPFKAITLSGDFTHKIDILRKDAGVFKKIHKILFSEWFDDNYFSLPSAHEVMYDFIKDNV